MKNRRNRDLEIILVAVGTAPENLAPLLRALRRAKWHETCNHPDDLFLALNTIRRLLRPEGTP
jgi:hypothetical protein